MIAMKGKTSTFADLYNTYLYPEPGKLFTRLHFDEHRFSLSLKEGALTELINKKDLCHISFQSSYDRISKLKFPKMKSRALNSAFLQYLKLRCPQQERFANAAITTIVASLVAMTREDSEDFHPDHLWKILKTYSTFQSSDVIYHGKRVYCERNSFDLKHFVLNIPQISLFGEFLYCCAAMDTNSDSIIAKIKRQSSELDRLLIDDISMNITPKLGILTFIVFRNWALKTPNLCYNNAPNAFHLFKRTVMIKGIYPLIQKGYRTAYKEIRRSPTLNEQFKNFLKYIGTEISQSHINFDYQIQYYNSNLSQWEYPSSRVHPYNHKTVNLVFILKYAAEIFIFIHNEKSCFNIRNYENILKYLENFSFNEEEDVPMVWPLTAGFYSTKAMLIAVSQILDFLFLENWKTDSSPAYLVKISNEVNSFVDQIGGRTKKFVDTHFLFPSYGVC